MARLINGLGMSAGEKNPGKDRSSQAVSSILKNKTKTFCPAFPVLVGTFKAANNPKRIIKDKAIKAAISGIIDSCAHRGSVPHLVCS